MSEDCCGNPLKNGGCKDMGIQCGYQPPEFVSWMDEVWYTINSMDYRRRDTWSPSEQMAALEGFLEGQKHAT